MIYIYKINTLPNPTPKIRRETESAWRTQEGGLADAADFGSRIPNCSSVGQGVDISICYSG